MKKVTIILSILLVLVGSCRQATKKQRENIVADNSIVLQKENIQECKKKEYRELPNVENVDLTKILPNGKAMYTVDGKLDFGFWGIIGDDVQYMGIVFLSITRINETEYEVIGKSKVKNNIWAPLKTRLKKSLRCYEK